VGFLPFGANEQVLARGGNKGPAWEWAVGTDTDAGQNVQGSLDWVSGRVYSWKLVNSGAGSAVLEIREAGSLRLSLAYPSGMDAGNALELEVSTNPSIGSETTIEASLTRLNGYGVSGSLWQSGMRGHSAQALYYYFPPMAQGFIAEGTVSLTFPKKLPTGSRVQFTVRAGTIPCGSTGNRPTVTITAPAANSVFSAPATVGVTANAQDSDGTVAQVAFFANGSSIGAATSSPFTIQWTNVQAGTYSLTAVATDNNGLQATSAAVPITVGAGQALYFIHVDHLSTPRLIADAAQKTVWMWDQREPFGNNPTKEALDGDLLSLSFSQRLPGQNYDPETNLHHNYYRDYDPTLGRYGESDPIGLRGGLNTYAYAESKPTSTADPKGLYTALWHRMFTLMAGVGKCLPVGALRDLATMVVIVDDLPDSQKVWNSHMHAMCALGLDPIICQKNYENYIANLRNSCDLDDLAKVIHAVQDLHAGGHRNFATFSGFRRTPPSHLYYDALPTANEVQGVPLVTGNVISDWCERCRVCR